MAKQDTYAGWLKDITSGSYTMNPFDFTDSGAQADAAAAFKAATGGGGHHWYNSVGSALKHAGSSTLKALSVPQAVLYTSAQKLAHAMDPTVVDDVSWKNMGGNFYGNYKGGAGVLKTFGVKNKALQKWAGLGLDFVADPLWLAAPAKILKGASTAEKAAAGEKALAVLDTARTLENPGRALETAVARHFQDAAGQPGTWAVRLGTKRHGVNVPVGIKAKAGLVNPEKGFKAGKIFQNKIQKAGAAVTRSVEETAGFNKAMIEQAAEHFGLSKPDRLALGVATAVGGPDGYVKYEQAIKALKDSGHWSPKMDEALTWVEGKYKTYGAERGHQGFLAHAQDAADRAANFDLRASDMALGRGAREDAAKAAQEARLEAADLASRAPFSHHTTTPASQELFSQFLSQQGDKGIGAMRMPAKKGMSNTGGRIDKARSRESMFAGTTPEQFVQDFVAQGGDPAAAKIIAGLDLGWGNTVARHGESAIAATPEWDAINRLAHYSSQHIRGTGYKTLEKQLAEHGVPKDSEAYRAVMDASKMASDPTALMHSKWGRRYQKAVAGQKSIYTTINPGHFTGNLTGDFVNSLIYGNRRHLLPSAIPGSAAWKLAQYDPKALAKTHNIAGTPMTGAELLANAHLAGIGRGFIGGEVKGHAPKWLESGKFNPARAMGAANNAREDAQRIGTWMKHMKGGEDLFSAGAKTIGSHFDYKALTPMEQKYMRNVFLFYTWMRKNAALQAKGLVLRPKIAKTINVDFERAREKYPNEPDYFAKMGVLPTPWGGVNFRSPTNDVFKLEPTMDSFRQNVLAAGNPFLRLPIELSMNKQAFSGAPIETYDGQMKASPWAWLANKAGADNMYLPYKGATEAAPSMPAKWAYLLSQIGGPYAGLAASQMQPMSEKNPWVDALSRLSGMGVLQNEPVKFLRQKQAIERKKKADTTRRSNLKVRG